MNGVKSRRVIDFYNFATYCFAKELVIHYVMSLVVEYFYGRPL